ncbi:MAG: DHA2 family efflux MFS transporter permease subunit [Actinophytocola sp.]|uniref:DHA2 family efflux MFS transporter permease subunit n=1 Tax=Actinophytocola sp. TaxID=1872138 RepID=UPI003D6A6F1A
MSAEAGTDRSRWLALSVLCVGMLMIVLDVTIVNVALPSIQQDLGFSPGNLAWVVNGYLIAFGGLLLLAGRLGDLVGQRKVFLIGLTIFTVASVACAGAQSQLMLIAARFVQGVGGALTSAVILGMIVTMFPEPKEQAKAIGVYGFVASAGGSIGLLAGGVLTDAINWHWIFLINVPVGVVTAVLAIRLIEARPGLGRGHGVDTPGAALLTAGLMLGVFTISQVEKWGWTAAPTLVLGAVSVGLVVAFLLRQGKVANPLMPLRLFRSRGVAGANLAQVLMVASMFSMFFLGALYLQQVLGYNPLEVGLAFLPTTFAMGYMSLRVSGPLTVRYGVRATLVPGMVLMLAGTLLFARTPVQADYLVDVVPALILVGLGAGLGFPGLMTMAMSDVEPSEAGLASGLVNTSAQVGGAIGLALLATLATEHTTAEIAAGEDPLAALNSGFHVAYLVGAALLVVGIGVALAALRKPTETTAETEELSLAEVA